MAKNIFVIVNSYNDYEGMSVATDGGAYSNFEKAKEKLIDYLHEIWDFRKDSLILMRSLMNGLTLVSRMRKNQYGYMMMEIALVILVFIK